MVNNSETCSAVKRYDKSPQFMKAVVPVSLVALDQYQVQAVNRLWGDRSLGVNVPVADMTEHCDSTP